MNDAEFNLLMEHYFSGEGTSGLESAELGTRLASDERARLAFVERARLEEGLTAILSLPDPVDPADILRKGDRMRRVGYGAPWFVGLAAAAVVVLGACWFFFGRGNDLGVSRAPSQSTATPLGQVAPGEWRGVLPNPGPRSPKEAPKGWIRRLENYVLPEMDLRGLTISAAVAKVEAEVNRIGFIDEVPEFRVHYDPASDEEEARVALRREQLPLMDTLLYLAAVGGRDHVSLGQDIRLLKKAEGFGSAGTRHEVQRFVLPEHFLQRRGAPDFVADLETEPVLVDALDAEDADLASRLRVWGVDLEEVSDIEYDSSSRVLLMTALPEAHGVLRYAIRLAANKRRHIAVETAHYTFFNETLPEGIQLGTDHIAFDDGSVVASGVVSTADDALRARFDGMGALKVGYPQVLTESGREATLESVEEVIVGDATDWTGVKFRCRPTMVGERVDVELDYERREDLGTTEIVEGVEYPVFASHTQHADLTVDMGGSSFFMQRDLAGGQTFITLFTLKRPAVGPSPAP